MTTVMWSLPRIGAEVNLHVCLLPSQSGLLVSYSYPDHCDALALMNAVYALATA